MGRYLFSAFALAFSLSHSIASASNHTVQGYLYPKGSEVEFNSKDCRATLNFKNFDRATIAFIKQFVAKQAVSVTTNGTCSQDGLTLTDEQNITISPLQPQGDSIVVYPRFTQLIARVHRQGQMKYHFVEFKNHSQYRLAFEGMLYDRGFFADFIKGTEGLTSDPRFLIQGVFTDAHSIEPHFIVPERGSGDTPVDLPVLAEGRIQSTNEVGIFNFVALKDRPLAFALHTLDDEAFALAQKYAEGEMIILRAFYHHFTRQISMHSSSEVTKRDEHKCEFAFLKPFFKD